MKKASLFKLDKVQREEVVPQDTPLATSRRLGSIKTMTNKSLTMPPAKKWKTLITMIFQLSWFRKRT